MFISLKQQRNVFYCSFKCVLLISITITCNDFLTLLNHGPANCITSALSYAIAKQRKYRSLYWAVSEYNEISLCIRYVQYCDCLQPNRIRPFSPISPYYQKTRYSIYGLIKSQIKGAKSKQREPLSLYFFFRISSCWIRSLHSHTLLVHSCIYVAYASNTFVINTCVLTITTSLKAVEQSLIRGGSSPRSNPFPFYIAFWQKRCPFYRPSIMWQGSLEVNPSDLIGSFLVGISPYGYSPVRPSRSVSKRLPLKKGTSFTYLPVTPSYD